MTPENAKKFLPLITAFANGEQLQYRPDLSELWEDRNEIFFTSDLECYRIKPKPTWRPWKPSECPKVFVVAPKSHKRCSGTYQAAILCVNEQEVVVSDGHASRCEPHSNANHEWLNFQQLFDQFVQILPDGSHQPCGILDTNPSA